eukprot:scpid65932/ scgid2539/ 
MATAKKRRPPKEPNRGPGPVPGVAEKATSPNEVRPYDDPLTARDVLESYKWLRKRDRRVFLCKLSESLSPFEQEEILLALTPLVNCDMAIYMAGAARNLFNTDLAGVEEDVVDRRLSSSGLPDMSIPGNRHKDGADNTGSRSSLQHSKSRLSSYPSAAAAILNSGASSLAPGHCVSTRRRTRSNPNTIVSGPFRHEAHQHQTQGAATRNTDWTKTSRRMHVSSRTRSSTSIDSGASGTSTIALTQRVRGARHKGPPGPLTVGQPPGLVTYHLHGPMHYRGEVVDKHFRRDCVRALGAEERDLRMQAANMERLEVCFAVMSGFDRLLLCKDLMKDLQSVESVELAAYFADCLRQRVKDRGFFHRASRDLVARILHFLQPHDACRLSLVCKGWKMILNRDMYWEHWCVRLGRQYEYDHLPTDIQATHDQYQYIDWKAEYHQWTVHLREMKEAADRENERKKKEDKAKAARMKYLMARFQNEARKLGAEAWRKSNDIFMAYVRRRFGNHRMDRRDQKQWLQVLSEEEIKQITERVLDRVAKCHEEGDDYDKWLSGDDDASEEETRVQSSDYPDEKKEEKEKEKEEKEKEKEEKEKEKEEKEKEKEEKEKE